MPLRKTKRRKVDLFHLNGQDRHSRPSILLKIKKKGYNSLLRLIKLYSNEIKSSVSLGLFPVGQERFVMLIFTKTEQWLQDLLR